MTMLRSALVAALLAVSATAWAQPRDDRHWYHGSIHNFHERDYAYWRGGHWYHGRYGGRFGWYWIVDGSYYWYPAPVYPYPDPYVPPTVAVAPAAPVVPAPAAPATPAPAAPTTTTNGTGQTTQTGKGPRGQDTVTEQATAQKTLAT